MGKKETLISDKRNYNFIDLTGQRFNKLLVLEYVYTKNGQVYWKCQCDCGNIKNITGSHLRTGHTKSCGCLQKEITIKRLEQQTKHGLRHTRIYETWVNMKTRCLNKNNKNYSNYGGRGIKVCDKWKNDFMSFYNWAMENGYRDDLTIDRIDVNGNYEPNNCRWTTIEKQNNNRRNNYVVLYKGESKTLEEWSKILPINISSSVLRYRIVHNWDIEKAFTKPVDRRRNRWKNEEQKRNNTSK